jgi:adenine-specific DNA methylase
MSSDVSVCVKGNEVLGYFPPEKASANSVKPYIGSSCASESQSIGNQEKILRGNIQTASNLAGGEEGEGERQEGKIEREWMKQEEEETQVDGGVHTSLILAKEVDEDFELSVSKDTEVIYRAYEKYAEEALSSVKLSDVSDKFFVEYGGPKILTDG